MKRLLAAAAIALACSIHPSASPATWAQVSNQTEKSIVRLTMTISEDGQEFDSVCTGEVIDNQRDFVLTADHCIGTSMKADGLDASPLWENKDADLAVLQVPGIDKPEIVPSFGKLAKGDEVATVGYGYGQEQPIFRHGFVANPDAPLPYPGFGSGKYVSLDTTYIGGMSGGPVVNQDGRMVGIVQLGDQTTGWGRGISYILKLTRTFWK